MNLPLAATGQIWHSYDFSAHVFFVSHYQRSWWSLWEPRWFEGFDVASYPPLAHQLSALLGWAVGNEAAVSIFTTASALAFPVAVYALARQSIGGRIAVRAAAVAVVTPSVLLAGYTFGQLPALFAMDAGLFAAAAFTSYLRRGGGRQLAILIALSGVVAAAHHATMLFFLPPLFGAVALGEAVRAGPRWRALMGRGLLAAVGVGAAALLVIFPFWRWHAVEYVSQVPIDHLSRHNFLQDIIAQDTFFWAEHGVLPAALIIAPFRLRRRFGAVAPWYALALFFLVVGLGGTTPLPRLLFGPQWEWLTYDRFSMWADVPLVLLFGAIASLRPAGERAGQPDAGGAREHLSRVTSEGIAWPLTLGLLGVFAVIDALLPTIVQIEPAPVDPRPMVAFLDARDTDAAGQPSWRYLTLGLGEQAGLLQARTNAGTVDGYYYTARRLPLLTESGIASLDFSLFWDPGAKTLRALLADPAPHSLRWVFTRDLNYQQILAAIGWQQTETLPNGIGVWETAEPVPPIEPAAPRSGILAIWWGIMPLTTLVAAGLLVCWRWPAAAPVEGWRR